MSLSPLAVVRPRRAVVFCFAASAILRTAWAAPLDPNAFTSLGTLNPEAGTYTANTSGTPTLMIGGTTYTGVVVSQGAGLPEIAVFTFDDVMLGHGVVINGVGSRPLAILSQGNITLTGNGSISVAAAGTTPGAGGGTPTSGNGGGPGGGEGAVGGGGGGGGFGGAGGRGAGGDGGAAYGNLSQALQGGSAGGRAINELPPSTNGASAGAGGGALEIGAAGTIALGATSILDARGAGGGAAVGRLGMYGAGGGSGGGLLLHAANFQMPDGAQFRASGGNGGSVGTQSDDFGGGGGGGGGRITVRTDAYIAGSTVAAVDVAGGAGGTAPFLTSFGQPGAAGVARFEAETTTVSTGTVFDFSAPSGFNEFATTNLNVQTGGVAAKTGNYVNSGVVTVESGGVFTATGQLSGGEWLLEGGTLLAHGGLNLGSTGEVTGTGLLAGSLRGSFGSLVEAPDGALTVGSATLDGAINFGGQFRVGSQTASGTRVGELVLLDAGLAEVNGVIRLLPGSSVSAPNGITLGPGGRVFALEGAASIDGAFTNNGEVRGPSAAGEFLTFTDDVTGAGSYLGNVQFSDGFSPGNSPAAVSFGNVAFDATAELLIELGGLVAGTQFDMLAVAGDALLGGELVVQLINGFVPQPGNEFLFLDIAGTRTGTFAGLDEGALIGNFGGTDLFITYQAGNGNDVAVFAVPAAVPEPSSLVLLSLIGGGAAACRACRRRQAQKSPTPAA